MSLFVCLAAVGRLKEEYWRKAAAEYTRRLGGYLRLELLEVDDVAPARVGSLTKALATEARSLRRALAVLPQAQKSCSVALDISGTPFSSEEIATLLQENARVGTALVFYIGGPCGLDADIRHSANVRLSFGPLTLPHNLARVVLLEQLYRACKINRAEPYHR
ncbi:MAG: 23S rRNA (pseudouridine(1915)-N(3))-methyltransferase RlmH [Coriobacteriales bacterium]|jgi:23S rRNA (pseudouridine1915-N3)-methyltransferase|nr:23S rRNA (pseudouridine(1915)-N(3))-methyltransferase RlmH [Coriobacteriales bacterium]